MSLSASQAIAADEDVAIEAALIASRINPALFTLVAKQVQLKGISIIYGFFSAPLIAEVDRFAREAMVASKGEYISFGADDGLPGYLLGAMDTAPWFHTL